jgi:hypothetical protein
VLHQLGLAHSSDSSTCSFWKHHYNPKWVHTKYTALKVGNELLQFIPATNFLRLRKFLTANSSGTSCNTLLLGKAMVMKRIPGQMWRMSMLKN